MSELRIATRASRLAMAQAKEVADMLSEAYPETEVTLIEVSTTGDRDRTTSVTTLTEVGAFVRSVQHVVIDGVADVAVHSCKDLPVDGPSELTAFYPRRERPWDVLCGHHLEELPQGARVGTGSPRRAAQLRRIRPDIEVADIRGNVDTRLAKMHSGEYDAVVLAEAGLRRLGREDEIDYVFDLVEMVPAPGQAVLAVEVLAGGKAAEIVSGVDDPTTRAVVETERALLGLTRAGCRSALGALATVDTGTIDITGFVEDGAGARFGQAHGPRPDDAARALKEELGL